MAHIHEKIDFTATVYVVHEDRVLLRLHEKYKDWFGVGGHIELDEDANAAAIREVKEEVGLEVKLVPPPGWEPYRGESTNRRQLVPPIFMNIHPISDTHQHHDLIFAAVSDTDAVTPEYEDDEWLWLTEAELMAKEDVGSDVKHDALFALKIARSFKL